MFASQSDKFLLGVYVSTAAVGLFNLPYLIYSTGYSITARVSEVLFPAISHMQGQGEKARMTNLLVRSSWLLSLLMVATQGTICIFAADIIRVFAGKDVDAAATQVLRVLAFTAMLCAPSVAMDQFLLGTARTQWTAISSIAAGSLTFVMSLMLIPRYGLVGAAWSDLAAVMLSRPLIHFLLWRNYLEEHIGLKDCFAFLYGPTVTGFAFVGMAQIGYARLGVQLPWFGLAVLMPPVFGLLILLMVFLDFFPRKDERRKDMSRLLAAGWNGAIGLGRL
jgi:O-antigen/teichoic acid export membrane protein